MDDFFLLRFGAVDLIVVFVCVAADDDAHADERYILLIETKNRRKRKQKIQI